MPSDRSAPLQQASDVSPSSSGATRALLVLASTYPVVQLVRTEVDQVSTVYDVTGTEHFVSSGSAGPVVQLTLGALSLLLLAHTLVRAGTAGTIRLGLWALLPVVLLAADLLRGQSDPLLLAYGGLTVMCMAFASYSQWNARQIEVVGWVTFATSLCLLLFAVLSPERGWAPCRTDKCVVSLGLLRGFFPQENVVALFLACMLPTIAYIRVASLRRTATVAAMSAVVLTGSRTGLAVLAAAFVAYLMIRSRAGNVRATSDVAKVLSGLPLLAFGASLALTFLLSDRALTGRGLIYRVIREGWSHSPLIGPGREILEEAYNNGTINWYVAHEHGQGSYVLAQGGALGIVVFTLCLMTIVVACHRSRGPLPAVFAMGPAVAFLTEPVWEVSIRGVSFMTLLLTVGMVSTALRRQPLPVPESRRKAVDAVSLQSRGTALSVGSEPGAHDHAVTAERAQSLSRLT